jgi:hypothetical protein
VSESVEWVLWAAKLDCAESLQASAQKLKKERAVYLPQVGGAEGVIAGKVKLKFELKNLP